MIRKDYLTFWGFARERIFSTKPQPKHRCSNLRKSFIRSTSPALLQNPCYRLPFFRSSFVFLLCRVLSVRWLGSSFAFLLTSHLFFNGVRECFAFLLGLCGCENAIFKSRIPIKLIKIIFVNVLPNSVGFGCLCPFV